MLYIGARFFYTCDNIVSLNDLWKKLIFEEKNVNWTVLICRHRYVDESDMVCEMGAMPLSNLFSIKNDVEQFSVLSPILF